MPSIGRMLLIGRLTVDGTIDSLSVDQNPAGGGYTALTLTAGSYYGYDPTAADSLLAEVQARIRTVGTLSSATVTFDGTTGKVTLGSSGSGANSGYTVQWDDTDLRDMLGFSGSTTAVADAGSTTGTLQALFCWRAHTTPTSVDDLLTEEGAQRSDARVIVAAGGQVVSTAINTGLKSKRIRFDALEGVRLHEMSGVTDLDWLSFWQRFIVQGRRIRVYTDDRSISATTDYTGTYVASQAEMSGPPQIDWIGGAQTVGALQIDLLKVVT